MVFSLRFLLTVVAFLALFAAALFYANRNWVAITSTIVIGLLVISVLGAVHSPRPMRTFWNGFAIVGWLYYGLSTSGAFDFLGNPWLLTDVAIDAAHVYIARDETLPPGVSPGGEIHRSVGARPDGSNIYVVAFPRQGTFRQVGHRFFTLILAYLGGLLALRFRGETRTGLRIASTGEVIAKASGD
jgi:hypothetical protein